MSGLWHRNEELSLNDDTRVVLCCVVSCRVVCCVVSCRVLCRSCRVLCRVVSCCVVSCRVVLKQVKYVWVTCSKRRINQKLTFVNLFEEQFRTERVIQYK